MQTGRRPYGSGSRIQTHWQDIRGPRVGAVDREGVAKVLSPLILGATILAITLEEVLSSSSVFLPYGVGLLEKLCHERQMNDWKNVLGGVAGAIGANIWLFEFRGHVSPFSESLGGALIWLYIITVALVLTFAFAAACGRWDTFWTIQIGLAIEAGSVLAALLMTDLSVGLDKLHPLVPFQGRSLYIVPVFIVLLGVFFRKLHGTRLGTAGTTALSDGKPD